jgi:F-type H+-transporting ATPase subunit a
MDIISVLKHHLLDHTIFPLFAIGSVKFGITKHLITMWVVGGGIIAVFTYAARGTSNAAVLLRNGIEVIALYLRDEVVNPLLGHDAPKYLHYFLSLFFFILGCNLFGLAPIGDMLKMAGVPFTDIGGTATGNVAVTMGLALCTLGLICFGSIRALGPVGFVKNFIPVPHGTPLMIALPLGALMFVIEIIGLVVKIFALTIRLFANMIAGHIVILGFMSLIFIFGAVSQELGVFVAGPFALGMVTFVNFLELLVGFLQAFIFTLLTAVFVGSMLHSH